MYSLAAGLELFAGLDVVGELPSLSFLPEIHCALLFLSKDSDRNLRNNPGYR